MKKPVPAMLKDEIVQQEPLADKSTFAALCTPQNVISGRHMHVGDVISSRGQSLRAVLLSEHW